MTMVDAERHRILGQELDALEEVDALRAMIAAELVRMASALDAFEHRPGASDV